MWEFDITMAIYIYKNSPAPKVKGFPSFRANKNFINSNCNDCEIFDHSIAFCFDSLLTYLCQKNHCQITFPPSLEKYYIIPFFWLGTENQIEQYTKSSTYECHVEMLRII